MKEAVEKSGREHSETMVRLDATIKTSIQQSKEAGERADKLAQALTGENKTQGNFGELRESLHRLIAMDGNLRLRPGHGESALLREL